MRRARLEAINELIDVLSPMATLRRGYSITRVDGHVVTSVTSLSAGMTLETTLSDGSVMSKVIL